MRSCREHEGKIFDQSTAMKKLGDEHGESGHMIECALTELTPGVKIITHKCGVMEPEDWV